MHSYPQWQSVTCLHKTKIPATALNWLLYTGSLTQRIKNLARQHFRVNVLKQQQEIPVQSEANYLDMAPRTFAVVREVQLIADEKIAVFAHSVFPLPTLTGKARRLTQLGSRPLAEVLFKDKTVQRSGFEIACLKPETDLYKKATQHLPIKPTLLWARRSLFFVTNKPLLVCEVFMPHLLEEI